MTSVHINNRDFFFDFGNTTFFPNFFLWGPMVRTQLHALNELNRMSPSRLARRQMVVNPVGWSQSVQNVEK